jgi:hypothetical protein
VHAAAVVGALAVLAAVTGCGVSTQSSPVLLETTVVGPATSHRGHEPTEEATQRRAIYLTRGAHLAEVFRQVPYAQGVDGSLAALEAAPTPDEAAAGLRTALPAGSGHLLSRVADGVAVVAVPPAYESLGLEQQVMAVGQIVYTVTAVEGVSAVELSVAGSVIDVPVADGQLRPGSVTRADYVSIAPPR